MQHHKGINTYSSIIILALVALLVPFVFGSVIQPKKDFHNEIWAPAYLLVHGENPYDTSSLKTELPAIWFPMAKGLFAPLGWLSENNATQLWFLFTVAGAFTLAFIALRDTRYPLVTGLAGLFVFFFPPVVNHFSLGQFSIIAALCSLLAARFAEKKQDWLAAFFLALGSTKPQLMFFTAIGLAYFYYRQSGLLEMGRFLLKSLVMALMMSLPLFFAHPLWIQSWLNNIQQNPIWLQPSVFLLLIEHVGYSGYIIWGGAALAGIFACLHLWNKYEPTLAVEWGLGLTTLIAPYIWSWDFVLLLPVWISTFAGTNWKNRIFLILAYALGWMGMAFAQINSNGNNRAFWWVPLWFMGVLVVITYRQRSQMETPKENASR